MNNSHFITTEIIDNEKLPTRESNLAFRCSFYEVAQFQLVGKGISVEYIYISVKNLTLVDILVNLYLTSLMKAEFIILYELLAW